MNDGAANFVYVSDLLAGRFPSVYEGLSRILSEHGIGVGVLPGTKDIWIRDYAPVQVDRDGSFVLFRYFPDYLRDGYRHLITDAREFTRGIPEIRDCEVSEIILDGGNVVRHHDKAIVTDKVFRENRKTGRDQLSEELRRLLRVEKLIVIPNEPGDIVGHADGVVRFADRETVVVNDYKQSDQDYRRVLMRKFKPAGLKVLEVPYRPASGSSEGLPSAVGNYVNFLRVGRLLVAPWYGLSADERARASLSEAHPGVTVETLPCRELSREGGALNCSTWSVRIEAFPSDSPISRPVPH